MNFLCKKVYIQATQSCVFELLILGIDVTEEVNMSADVVLVRFAKCLKT